VPDRSYTPLNDPPTRMDHFKAHPEWTILSVVSIIVGSLVISAVIIPDFVPSRSVEALALRPSLSIGLFLVLGGACTWWGAITTHAQMRMVWNTLRSGLLALGFGWAGYAASVIATYPESVIPWLTSLGLSAAWFVSFWVARRGESYLRSLLVRHPAPRAA